MGVNWESYYRPENGGEGANGAALENLRVENCILWTDRAHVWRIGCESRAEAMRQFIFGNIDVLHFPDLWTPDEVPFCISLEPSDELPLENFLFEDIRIRTTGQRGFIDVRPKVTQWARKPVPGRIQNVVFRNVSFTGPAGQMPGRIRISGPGPDHAVANVSFENVTRSNESVTATAPGVEVLGFVHGISFTGSATSPETAKPIPDRQANSATAGQPRRQRPIVLIEARQARGVIATQGGADGLNQAAVVRLQDGFKRATGTLLPVVEEAAAGPAVILGDSTQAEAEGMEADQIPAGEFEIRTTRHHVLIVGDAAGVLRGVDRFFASALDYVPDGTTETGTDLVVAPISISRQTE